MGGLPKSVSLLTATSRPHSQDQLFAVTRFQQQESVDTSFGWNDRGMETAVAAQPIDK